MNVKQIRELAQIVRENGLSAIEIGEGDTHVRIERAAAPAALWIALPKRGAQGLEEGKGEV